MAKKPAPKAAKAEVASVEIVAEAPKFTACARCPNPGDCARAAKCVKKFK